jgi:DNA-binding protein HU-beta
MNKSELTAKLAKTADIAFKDAKTVIDCIFDTRPRRGIIAAELDAGRKVTIAGFGTFEMRRRRARVGRNPRTGQPIEIGASKYPAFKSGVSFKSRTAKIAR